VPYRHSLEVEMKNFKEINKNIPRKDVIAAFVCVGILIFSLVLIHIFDIKYLSFIKETTYGEVAFLLIFAELLNIAYKIIRRKLA
jgi:hypothetical protein